MGPTWGQQDPGGPHVGPMNLAIWVWLVISMLYITSCDIGQCYDVTQLYPEASRNVSSWVHDYGFGAISVKVSLPNLDSFTESLHSINGFWKW